MSSLCSSPPRIVAILVLCGIVSFGLLYLDHNMEVTISTLRRPSSIEKVWGTFPPFPSSSVLPSHLSLPMLYAPEPPASLPSLAPSSTDSAILSCTPQSVASSTHLSRGVVLIAMTTDAVAAAAATLESARSLARASLQAHLFTSINVSDSSLWSAVSVIQHIPSSLSLASLLWNSSFHLSLLLTPGDTVCTDVHAVLDLLSDWDVLLNVGSASFGGTESLGMLGYRTSPAFHTLLSSWLLSDSGSHGVRSLIKYVATRPPGVSVNIGVLLRQVEVRFFPAELSNHVSFSALIPSGGNVLSYPMRTSSANRANVCGWVNGKGGGHVVLHNSSSGATSPVFDHEAVCRACQPAHCDAELWRSTPALIVPLFTFLRLPSASPSPVPVAERTINGLTYGVLLFAYSQNAAALPAYLADNAVVAEGIRAASPTIPITMFTNADRMLAATSGPWDSVISIPNELLLPGRQWWSRTMSLNSTPYDLSVMIDSGSGVCGDVMQLFSLMISEGWDMLGASGGLAGGPGGYFQNGVLGFRGGPKFDALHATWLDIQLRMDKGGDDQHTLGHALHRHPEFRAGVMQPRFHLIYTMMLRSRPAVRNMGMRHSLVITGPVLISPGVMPGASARERLCDWHNKGRVFPHVIVMNASAYAMTFNHAFSPAECQVLAGEPCSHPELNWTAVQPLAIPFAKYIQTHTL